jgi:flagellar biosynthesis protein FlhF
VIIKKFQGTTENEALLKAKEELGEGAVVMNIKTTKPKGMFRVFRKTVVEVTAAVDDNASAAQTKSTAVANKAETARDAATPADADTAQAQRATQIIEEAMKRQTQIESDKARSSAIEKKLDNLADMLEKQMDSEHTVSLEDDQEPAPKPEKASESAGKSRNDRIRALLYNQFLENEVNEKYAHMLVEEIKDLPDKESALDAILANVYQRIILKLGQPKVIQLGEQKKPRVCFFVGSTGVGKTTTIAKIASAFKLEKKAKVALVTSDTYRIAAVEQLKTYANILSVPIRVVYNPAEMQQTLKDYESYDLVLVDTAGRSPRNQKQCDELAELLDSVDEELREVYLVLSATTKYKDLKQIVSIYEDMADYRIVFTKLDETSCYGNILNIRLDTGAPLSYVTCGQVVPDDIENLNSQAIAKQLLGRCE